MTQVRFKHWVCVVRKSQYGNDRPALQLIDAEDGSPIATATVNLPDVPLGRNQVAIKNYSENAGMLEALVDAGVVKPTGQTVPSGYAEVSVYELQPPFREPTQIDKLAEKSSGRGKGRAR